LPLLKFQPSYYISRTTSSYVIALKHADAKQFTSEHSTEYDSSEFQNLILPFTCEAISPEIVWVRFKIDYCDETAPKVLLHMAHWLAASIRATGVLRTQCGVKFMTWQILYLCNSTSTDWQKS